MNEKRLFIACCVSLIATAMSFAIRGDIMGDFERDFVIPYVTDGGETSVATDDLIKTPLGLIGSVAFFSFGLSILFGGPLVDLLGMGRLLRLAAVCHIGGALMTIFAPSYWVVVAATLVVGAGNGLVEAVCNPLIATMYPKEKTHKLTLFHAWFPGGIVIGGLLAYGISQIGLDPGVAWKVKMSLILVPAIIYTVMILGQKFPATERVAAGLRFSQMFTEAITRPLFIIIALLMVLTASTELGPGTWIANIYNDVIGEGATGGILFLVWGNGLMYVLRQFFSKQAHSISPIALISITAPAAALGLFLIGNATTPVMWFVASTLIFGGVAFWWPTMLGITSERCPKTGALGLAVVGGIGSFATSAAGPAIGLLNDRYGPGESLQRWAILPVVLCIAFALVYFRDRSTGGYQREVLNVPDEGA